MNGYTLIVYFPGRQGIKYSEKYMEISFKPHTYPCGAWLTLISEIMEFTTNANLIWQQM